MIVWDAMHETIRSYPPISTLQRAYQRLSHRSCMIKYMSGLVKDLKFSHLTSVTCWPHLMQTTQECTPRNSQMTKQVEIAKPRQRTLPLLRPQTLSHNYHLEAVVNIFVGHHHLCKTSPSYSTPSPSPSHKSLANLACGPSSA
jgi:hypothetical protein